MHELTSKILERNKQFTIIYEKVNSTIDGTRKKFQLAKSDHS